MEFRETEQAETARLVELTLWIEGNIKTWNERGVDVLQKDGQYLWSWMDATGKVGTGRLLFFGTVADCAKRPLKRK